MKLHLLLNRKFNFQQFTPRPPQTQNMSCPNKDRAFLPDSNCSFWLRVLLSMSIHPLGWKTTPGNAPKFVLFPYKFIRKKEYSSNRAYMEIFSPWMILFHLLLTDLFAEFHKVFLAAKPVKLISRRGEKITLLRLSHQSWHLGLEEVDGASNIERSEEAATIFNFNQVWVFVPFKRKTRRRKLCSFDHKTTCILDIMQENHFLVEICTFS